MFNLLKIRKKAEEFLTPDKFFPRIWEKIDEAGTMRLKVFGGWVIYSSWEGTETMCFVPDPDHKWKLAPFGSKISEGMPKGINEQQEKQ